MVTATGVCRVTNATAQIVAAECQGALRGMKMSLGRDRYSSQYRRKPVLSPNLTGQADHVTWSAQVGPVLNAHGPDVLREAIKRAYAELLEEIGEQARGVSPAATGKPSALAVEPAGDLVAEP